MKPCKSANYFVKVNVYVVMNVQQGKKILTEKQNCTNRSGKSNFGLDACGDDVMA